MTRLITVIVYELAEVRVELARRTGKHEPYSRQRVSTLIQRYLPTVDKVGGQYFLTAAELDELARCVQSKKRPTIY